MTAVATRAPTGLEALLALYLLNDARRAPTPPSSSWFHRHGVLTGLVAVSRRSARRLILRPDCFACGRALAKDTEGDHVVAVSRGGPNDLTNYAPLCGRCNSSKNAQDLLGWWAAKGRPVAELPPDVLTAYLRIMLGVLGRERALNDPAPGPMVAALRELVGDLGPDHLRALRERVRWIVGPR